MSENATLGSTVDAVMTREETARSLRVSLRTLRRMEKNGEAPTRTKITERISGYRVSVINAFLAERTGAAA